MGKRKKSSRKPVAAKKREPLETTFSCIFCHHEKSVACKIDKKQLLGTLYCKICGQTFQTRANYLTEPVDIFADWIDSAAAASNSRTVSGARGPISPTDASASARSRPRAPVDEGDEMEAAPKRRFVQADSDDED